MEKREEPISLGIGTVIIIGTHHIIGQIMQLLVISSYTETQTIDDILGLGNSTTKGILGVLTATSFIGDGSAITGITLNIGNISNYVVPITYVDALNLVSELFWRIQ